MDDQTEKRNVQAANNSIAIGEIDIGGTVTGNIHIGPTIIQAADAQLRHDLGILLKNVQTTWIKGVLERSVHEAALLGLGMEIREDAVDNPWRMVMEAPDQTREILPRGKKIEDIFYEANGLLLILGEPGSGKTTTLLQLARDLVTEIDPAFTQPVPVVLNLSTWTNKEQPLDEWLVTELANKYRVPKKDGRRWLEGRRILPLLDGLDEVKAENQAACVEKINQLVKDYGLQAVVCSRIQEYTALNVRLGFYRAIYIQPLTPEQVEEYLKSAGDKLASLRAILQDDESLKEMAQSPLILNIMSLAYQNTSAEALRDPSLNTNEARRQHLFDTYIARMFKRKTGERPYGDEQTRRGLSWLARNMQQYNQEVFLMEGLQPSWLTTQRWLYLFTSRLLSGLALGLSFGLNFGWVRGWFGPFLSIGLTLGFLDILRFHWLQNKGLTKALLSWWPLVTFMIVGVISGLSISTSFGIIIGPFLGLIMGLRGSRQYLSRDIQTVEALSWSGRSALIGGLIGAAGGLLFAILLILTSVGIFIRNSVVLNLTLTSGLIFGLLGLILNGLRPKIIETKTAPNQGIQLSIRNAILGGLIIGTSFGLFSEIAGPLPRLLGGWRLGLSAGLAGALWYGGFDIIQHYVLRLILILQGFTPRNLAHFLDYAVDHIFLQKVGGGYRFIHRLLLEHFADMRGTTRKA